MKRILSIILALVVLPVSIVFADVPDVKVLTDEELVKTINLAFEELAHRSIDTDNILVELFELTAVRDGDSYVKNEYLNIPIILYNDSDDTMTLGASSCVINGWTATAISCLDYAEPHSRLKTKLSFKLDGTDCKTLEDVKSIDVKYHLEMTKDGEYYHSNKDVLFHLIP